MAGQGMELPAFHVQMHPTAPPLHEVILDAHREHRIDGGEAVNHETDQSAIAETDQPLRVDRVEQRPRFLGREQGRLALLHRVLRPAHRVNRIEGKDSVRDKAIWSMPSARPVACCIMPQSNEYGDTKTRE